MNIEQEIRAQIEKNKGLKLAVGEINNHLSILEGLLRNERDDVQKQVDEAYHRGYDKGYADKTNNDEVSKELAKDVYQRGLDDAWEAAKKIALMDTETSENVTGYFGLFRIMENLTPMQAIENLKAYEEKQKADDEIKVGDEVVWTEDEDTVIIVTLIYTSSGIEWCDGICRDGKVYQIITEHARKTGRHFDIESILEDMRCADAY